MKVIWKAPLVVIDRQIIKMPADAVFLSAAIDNKTGEPAVWYMCEKVANPAWTHRIIRVVGTGHEFEPHAESFFIGTVVQGPFVWHIFEQEDEAREPTTN